MKQRLGVELSYKASGEAYMNMRNVSEVLEYFNHLQDTAEKQNADENGEAEVDLLDIRMDLVSQRKFIQDVEKLGLDMTVTNTTRKVALTGETRKVTYLNFPQYTVKIRP